MREDNLKKLIHWWVAQVLMVSLYVTNTSIRQPQGKLLLVMTRQHPGMEARPLAHWRGQYSRSETQTFPQWLSQVLHRRAPTRAQMPLHHRRRPVPTAVASIL